MTHHVRTITIHLIRHAPTLHDKGTLPPYDPDVDLSQQGRISALAGVLPPSSVWWVSPLLRCRKTADALKKAGASPSDEVVLNTIEEQRYGTWHGRPVADIWDEVKDGPKSNWHFLHPSIRPPEGESFDDLITRLIPVMNAIQTSDIDHITIIAHAMVIKALIGMAMGLDSGQSLAFQIDHLSRTTLTYMAEGSSNGDHSGGPWQINRLNEIL